MKTKKQRKIMVLIILLLAVTIGFALLSTTLKINGTAGIKKNTWNIHWNRSSVSVASGSVEASDPVVGTTTATDDTDGDITAKIKIDISKVDVKKVGTYTVTYTVSDSSGNTETKIRTIKVIADEKNDEKDDEEEKKEESEKPSEGNTKPENPNPPLEEESETEE